MWIYSSVGLSNEAKACQVLQYHFKPLEGEFSELSQYSHLPAGNSHSHLSEDRQRRSEFCSRMVSEPNIYLDSFSYPDHGPASDTISVDSSDSLETSFSACSPDNISRLQMYRWSVTLKCGPSEHVWMWEERKCSFSNGAAVITWTTSRERKRWSASRSETKSI